MYILMGIYSRLSMKEPESAIDIKWDSIMLAFTNKEMTFHITT